ncbi:DsbA family protein [Pelagibacterium montanilacus]|uniref:DsbA family protein n=1 Tax=Pelagibacterium montanilacus TaxID=2185280 RepID=UPI0013E00507|nr:DsbA family protein [Pelagibacterium montanilacus]
MQTTVNIVLGAAVLGLAGALVASHLSRPAPGPSEAEIAAMIDRAVAEQVGAQAAAGPAPDTAFDSAGIDERIESYLLENPRLLERMSTALEQQLQAEESEMARVALTEMADDIYSDPDNIVLGNPEGDVTLVELFDYNCGYCRQVVADVLSLVEEDPNLRVILKEFPILSQGSVDAARVGILVNREENADYAAFHTALFSARGAVDREAALEAAESVGLNRVTTELDMEAADVTSAIERSYSIAQGLGISGTPTFIIGNEVLPGAVPKAELARRIANMRACGSTVCDQS